MRKYPNLAGKTILITGSTDGIGRETARMFAHSGANLVLHGRNPQKMSDLYAELRLIDPLSKIDTYLADFASFTAVHQMAEKILAEQTHLDVMINNAGFYPFKRELTEDNFEKTLQVNYLAHFLLTELLRPLLLKSAPMRVINMSSIGHRFVWDNIHDPKGAFFWRWVNYCRSKLLIIPWTAELAEQLAPHGITVNSLHPGIIRTKVIRVLPITWGSSIRSGASTVFNLAVNADLQGVTGKYFERYKVADPAPAAKSHRLQKNLWQKSLVWTGLQPSTNERSRHRTFIQSGL